MYVSVCACVCVRVCVCACVHVCACVYLYIYLHILYTLGMEWYLRTYKIRTTTIANILQDA